MADMTDRLRDTARAYLDAVAAETAAKAAVEEAQRRRAAAREAVAKARTPLADAIVEAAREGVRQRDILTRIENAYTRERIRQICQSAGLQDSRRGRREGHAASLASTDARRNSSDPAPNRTG